MEIRVSQEIIWKYSYLLKQEKEHLSYKKMIVHWGMHHEDETSARAVLLLLWIDVPVERKNKISDEEILDPSVIVIDVGLVYDDSTSCYDHHQDWNLPASCSLILENFMKDGDEKKALASMLFDDISYRDVNWVSTSDTNIVSDVVFALNLASTDGYKNAVQVFAKVIVELLDTYNTSWKFNDISIETKTELMKIYDSIPWVEKIKKAIANSNRLVVEHLNVIELPELITRKFLLDYKNNDDMFCIAAIKNWEYWVQSFDLENYPLIEEDGHNQRFYHAKRYFAIYTSKEAALASIRNAILSWST